ncbi:hypothetical protein HS088_TW14G01105 [Tripterygium wilfordii]|uniref:Uncharacterized protein n=1 Tax=Tripterygium wilfordii TaxID=458696 RepID=A0A7J7CS89_TRIWF|nr:hypothetical protein HS088_TW14G01105 [Tripterygium wilfordii]
MLIFVDSSCMIMHTIMVFASFFLFNSITEVSLVCRCGCIKLDGEAWFIELRGSATILVKIQPVAGNPSLHLGKLMKNQISRKSLIQFGIRHVDIWRMVLDKQS